MVQIIKRASKNINLHQIHMRSITDSYNDWSQTTEVLTFNPTNMLLWWRRENKTDSFIRSECWWPSQPSKWLQICSCVLCLLSLTLTVWAAQCFLMSAARNETGSSQLENQLHHHPETEQGSSTQNVCSRPEGRKIRLCYNPMLKRQKHPECTAACTFKGWKPADYQRLRGRKYTGWSQLQKPSTCDFNVH